MQRTHIESALSDIIYSKNEDLALEYIRLLQTHSYPIFRSTSNQYLIEALQHGLPKIADALVEVNLKENPLHNFDTDDRGRTTLWLAAQNNFLSIAKKIVQQAKQCTVGMPGYKIWLTVDDDANSPLHISVDQQNDDMVAMLLEQIRNESNAIDHINRVNNDENTPLHLACSQQPLDENIIQLLSDHGATWSLLNKSYHSPFTLLHQLSPINIKEICRLSLEQQITYYYSLEEYVGCSTDKIYRSKYKSRNLSEECQFYFLDYYKDYIISLFDKNSPKIKNELKKYFTLARLHGLMTYTIAKFEFDSVIQRYYLPLFQNKDSFKYPASIFELVPRFTKILEDTCHKINQQKNFGLIVYSTSSSSSSEENEIDQFSYELLQKDRETLNLLLEKIDMFLKNVETLPTVSVTGMKKTIIFFTVLLLTYALVESLLVYKSHDSDEDYSYRKATLYFGILFGVLVILPLVGAAFIMGITDGIEHAAFFNDTPQTISNDAWNELTDEINLTLLEPLQSLEKNSKNNSYVCSLPIKTLENHLNEFNCEVKEVVAVKSDMEMIKEDVKKIRGKVIKANIPFSMFYKSPHQIILMDEKNDPHSMRETYPFY